MEDSEILKASRNCDADKEITFLIENGANINDKDQIGQTPLIVATQHGCKKIVELLIGAGADIHERNDFGQSAIITAAQENQLEIAKFLIESGADVNAKDAEGETPYTYALQIHRGKRTPLSDLFLAHMTDNSGKGLKKKVITPFLFENAHYGAFSSAKSNGSIRIFNAQRCKKNKSVKKGFKKGKKRKSVTNKK